MTDPESKLELAMSAIAECRSGIEATERSIALLEGHDIDELRHKLTDLESAKLNVCLAFCLASLMYASLHTKVNYKVHAEIVA